MVRVRFAPSPTGYLHIGSARTALFNWLFARHHGGEFLLRIEDTDRARSTDDAVQAIFKSMQWLGLDHDGEAVFQFARADRHAEVAREMVQKGHAYYCYCSPEEVEAMREAARLNNEPPRYNGYWRDRDPSEAPAGVQPAIRFKAPADGSTTLVDSVQGTVTLENKQLDDMILLRADGTPTYMLSVVVDDHDMGITHIIRGDDHFTNAFRQYHLYQAMGWDVPHFSHIPLIHGPDGAKLSKRHGALGAEAYQEMGFLAESMRNYLMRLGWSHGDDEIIPTEQAIQWFDGSHIGKSPARFDIVKLTNLNAHYIRTADNATLLNSLKPFLIPHNDEHLKLILKGLDGLKERAKTLLELAENATFYINRPEFDDKAKAMLTQENHTLLNHLIEAFEKHDDYTHDAIEALMRVLAVTLDVKLGVIAGILRVAITGRTVSPSLFDIISVFGKDTTLARMQSVF
jgi:glutamyl-tRNA synthetase